MTKTPTSVPYDRFRAVLERAKAAEAELATLRREQMQDRAAQLVGLPLELASRLSGERFEDYVEDARRFRKELGL